MQTLVHIHLDLLEFFFGAPRHRKIWIEENSSNQGISSLLSSSKNVQDVYFNESGLLERTLKILKFNLNFKIY